MTCPAHPKHRLQDMTWTEFRDRLPERPVILLPLGAQEEQGPTAPMGDFMLADRIAAEVAARSGAIAAPTIPVGDSEFFRAFPGCISLRPATFVALIHDICASFLDHGLDRIVILNGQTSNAPHLDTVTRQLRAEYGVMIPCLHLWRIVPVDQWRGLLDPAIAGPAGTKPATGHGGDPITSMYMHYFPELVRQDLLPGRQPWKTAMGLPTRSVSSVDFQGVPVSLPLDIADMTDDGVLSGDSRFSSADVGRAMADHIVAFATAFVEHVRGQDMRAAPRGP